MKVLIQWALLLPEDWQQTDSKNWQNLISKNEPNGIEAIDLVGGWINALNVQGVVFEGFDHYHVQHLSSSGGCRVTVWNDDEEDYSPDDFEAHVWTFLPLAPDKNFGGQLNTNQTIVTYAGKNAYKRWIENGPYVNRRILPYVNFVPPSIVDHHRHGIWLPDDLFQQHQIVRTIVGWTEWIE